MFEYKSGRKPAPEMSNICDVVALIFKYSFTAYG